MRHLYLDESGDHSLTSIDARYPVFVLGGVLVADHSLIAIERSLAAFKSDFFGDAQILLHTADIARNRHGFESLAEPRRRARFRGLLNDVVRRTPTC